jgi:hypothetical protein
LQECPNCAAKEQEKTPAGTPAGAPAETSKVDPVPPPVAAAPAPSRGMPAWLVGILSTLGFAVLLGGVYFFVEGGKRKTEVSPAPAPVRTAAAPAPSGPPRSNPMQKNIEVAGLRLLQDKAKKTEVRFVVINHSGAEFSDISVAVTVLGRTAKGAEDAVGTFQIKIPLLGPYETKDLSAPVDTKLQVYELPDWQLLRAEPVFGSS